MTTDTAILRRLVALRRASGLDQREVGRRMHISRMGVAMFERKARDGGGANLETALRYAHAIGADLEVVST